MSEANNYYSECNNSPFHLGNCNNNLVTPATPIFASIDDDFSPSPIHTNTVLDFDVEANEHPALHSSQQLNESLAQMNESLAKQLAETTISTTATTTTTTILSSTLVYYSTAICRQFNTVVSKCQNCIYAYDDADGNKHVT